ncbi:MAG: acyl-CoA thioesterase [Cyanobacteria bacterium]|nr:acyl-CoA thioesterase [Cyanobacteriota bacterium]
MLQPFIHELRLDVHIFDTDCFGVMWHGAYVKWLEMGRVELMNSMGIRLSKPGEEAGYVYPVVDQHFRFRSPAQMADKLLLTTSVTINGHKLVFEQTFSQQETEKIVMQATTTVVVVDMQWRTQRRLPAELLQKLQEASA